MQHRRAKALRKLPQCQHIAAQGRWQHGDPVALRVGQEQRIDRHSRQVMHVDAKRLEVVLEMGVTPIPLDRHQRRVQPVRGYSVFTQRACQHHELAFGPARGKGGIDQQDRVFGAQARRPARRQGLGVAACADGKEDLGAANRQRLFHPSGHGPGGSRAKPVAPQQVLGRSTDRDAFSP